VKSSLSSNLILPPAVEVCFDRGCYSCTFQQRYCVFIFLGGQNADIQRKLFIFCPSVCKLNILL